MVILFRAEEFCPQLYFTEGTREVKPLGQIMQGTNERWKKNI